LSVLRGNARAEPTIDRREFLRCAIARSPTGRQKSDVASIADFALAVEATKWQILKAVVTRQFVYATALLEIARDNPAFRGAERSARYHATALAKAHLIEPVPGERQLAFRGAAKGRLVHAHLSAALEGRGTEDIQSAAESRVLAVLAQLGREDYETFDLGSETQYELVAKLSKHARRVARTRARLRVTRLWTAGSPGFPISFQPSGEASPGPRSMSTKKGPNQGLLSWAILDSNQGPPPYQSGALTS
jgi:hypothetical protein